MYFILGIVAVLLPIVALCVLYYEALLAEKPAMKWAGYVYFLAVLAALGLQAASFREFLPALWEANRSGVGPQDIFLLEEREKARSHFAGGDAHLARLDAARGDPADPCWAEAEAFVRGRLGDPVRFERDVWGAFLAWGRSLAEPPETGGPVSDAEALRAGLARVLGRDARSEWFLARSSLYRRYIDQAHTFHLFYPNEDITLLSYADGFWPPRDDRDGWDAAAYFAVAGGGIFLLGVLLQRSLRLVTLSLLGRVLFLGRDPVFLRLEREAFNPGRYLLLLGLAAAVTAPVAFLTVEPFYVLVYHRVGFFWLAVLWNLLLGGILVENLGYVVAVLFVRFGLDPMRTVLDNIVVAAVAVWLLLVFQNGWLAIGGSLAVGLLQSLAGKHLFDRTSPTGP